MLVMYITELLAPIHVEKTQLNIQLNIFCLNLHRPQCERYIRPNLLGPAVLVERLTRVGGCL